MKKLGNIIHPLTPQKTKTPARVAGFLTGLVAMFGVSAVLFGFTAAQGTSPFDGDMVYIDWDAIAYLLVQIHRDVQWNGSTGGLADFISIWVTRPFVVLHAYGTLGQVIIRVAAVAAGSIWCGRLIFESVLRQQPAIPDVSHVSGPRPCFGSFGKQCCRDAWRDRLIAEGEGIEVIPGVKLPLGVECEQIAVLGATGSGKSTIIDGISLRAAARGDRTLRVEVKGSLSTSVGQADTAELGLDVENLFSWSIGEDIRDRQDAAELAEILIPPSRDPIWSDGARMYTTGLVVSQQQQHGTRWNWQHLHQFLSKPFAEQEVLVKRAMPDIQLLIQKKDGDEDVANAMLSILITVAAHIGAITWTMANAQRRAGKAFSLRAWATGRSKIRHVILHLEFDKEAQSVALLKLLLGCLRKTLLGREVPNAVDHRLWLFLDELPTFCDAGGTTVDRLVSLGRSRGLRSVVALQDPAQLRARLGTDQTTALLANFGLKIITRVVPGPGASEIASWFGNRTVTWNPARTGGDQKNEWPLPSIPVLSASDLNGLLGKFYTVTGTAFIRAAILGPPDVPILDWPIRAWTQRLEQ